MMLLIGARLVMFSILKCRWIAADSIFNFNPIVLLCIFTGIGRATREKKVWKPAFCGTTQRRQTGSGFIRYIIITFFIFAATLDAIAVVFYEQSCWIWIGASTSFLSNALHFIMFLLKYHYTSTTILTIRCGASWDLGTPRSRPGRNSTHQSDGIRTAPPEKRSEYTAERFEANRDAHWGVDGSVPCGGGDQRTHCR